LYADYYVVFLPAAMFVYHQCRRSFPRQITPKRAVQFTFATATAGEIDHREGKLKLPHFSMYAAFFFS
jgi:hypothetical protein